MAACRCGSAVAETDRRRRLAFAGRRRADRRHEDQLAVLIALDLIDVIERRPSPLSNRRRGRARGGHAQFGGNGQARSALFWLHALFQCRLLRTQVLSSEGILFLSTGLGGLRAWWARGYWTFVRGRQAPAPKDPRPTIRQDVMPRQRNCLAVECDELSMRPGSSPPMASATPDLRGHCGDGKLKHSIAASHT